MIHHQFISTLTLYFLLSFFHPSLLQFFPSKLVRFHYNFALLKSSNSQRIFCYKIVQNALTAITVIYRNRNGAIKLQSNDELRNGVVTNRIPTRNK